MHPRQLCIRGRSRGGEDGQQHSLTPGGASTSGVGTAQERTKLAPEPMLFRLLVAPSEAKSTGRKRPEPLRVPALLDSAILGEGDQRRSLRPWDDAARQNRLLRPLFRGNLLTCAAKFVYLLKHRIVVDRKPETEMWTTLGCLAPVSLTRSPSVGKRSSSRAVGSTDAPTNTSRFPTFVSQNVQKEYKTNKSHVIYLL